MVKEYYELIDDMEQREYSMGLGIVPWYKGLTKETLHKIHVEQLESILYALEGKGVKGLLRGGNQFTQSTTDLLIELSELIVKVEKHVKLEQSKGKSYDVTHTKIRTLVTKVNNSPLRV